MSQESRHSPTLQSSCFVGDRTDFTAPFFFNLPRCFHILPRRFFFNLPRCFSHFTVFVYERGIFPYGSTGTNLGFLIFGMSFIQFPSGMSDLQRLALGTINIQLKTPNPGQFAPYGPFQMLFSCSTRRCPETISYILHVQLYNVYLLLTVICNS